MLTSLKGRFITFEGGEGAGKSSQLQTLAETLRNLGRQVVTTREPGGTAGAEIVRELVLSAEHEWTAEAEILLHFAARADHVARIIRPALDAGAWVISDRFSDSTVAYQGYGQGVELDFIRVLARKVSLVPDLTIILDVSEDTARRRIAKRGICDDRYDMMGTFFHAKVADAFRDIAASEPERCVLINANPDAEAVAAAILAVVQTRLL